MTPVQLEHGESLGESSGYIEENARDGSMGCEGLGCPVTEMEFILRAKEAMEGH